jgi:hypothetical protein
MILRSQTFIRKIGCCIALLVGLSSVGKGQVAGAGAAGAGGAGGGSNVYSFRYVFLSRTKQLDSLQLSRSKKADKLQFASFTHSIDTAYTFQSDSNSLNQNKPTKTRQHYYRNPVQYLANGVQDVVNGMLIWSLKISKTDSVARRLTSMVSVAKPVTETGFLIMPNACNHCKSDTIYQFSPGFADSAETVFEDHNILYDRILPDHRLSFYILGRNQDTLMFEIWPRPRRLQNRYFGSQTTIIDGFRNGDLLNWTNETYQINHPADTFYAVIPWRNHGVGPRFQSFNLLFFTKYLIPITVPINYCFGAKSWQTSFLNAGMAYGWAIGRTKFYRDGLQASRNFYWGGGVLGGVSSVTLNAASVNPKNTAAVTAVGTGSGYTLPGTYVGGHLGFSFNSLQIMVSGTVAWALGSYSSAWIYQHKFSLGLAIGLSSFNLLVPNSASAPFTH